MLFQECEKEREKIHERYNKLQETLGLLKQELHDTKIALDMEINVFRQLLECEEDRLGLGASKSLNSSGEEKKPEIRTSVERKSE